MSKTIKSVCVYGIGGVGGYFGGRIAHEISKGNRAVQVYFIGRGEHLKVIQQQGLNLITDKEEFTCFPNIATDNIRHIPTPDLYLLCVKRYDLDNAVVSISKNISADTIVLPLLNGVDIYESIRATLQKAIVSPASVYVSSSIEKPGTVRQRGPEGHIVFGKDPKLPGYNYEYFIEFLNELGISNTWHDTPYSAIWKKYIFITAFSLVTAYSGKTIGGVIADDKLRNMVENIMNEVASLGKVRNIDFEQDIVEKNIQKARNFPYETKTSFQRDYEKGNTRNEVDIFGGTLIRLAKEYNTSIPTITDVYRKLTAQ
ncbi:MAG TPA: 2-dehydropantoate 2-reductase [Candidatus Atribacteria bacterium]|nr:MAG: 2-dehydropantoate 2-reductase [Atribacteria bacterium 34_128]HAJ33534.1 2-dehydropantoate 2-reductase [Candidatus Atribacteria bacterium]